MTLNQFKLLYQEQLAPLYPENEIHSILQIVCEDLLNWSRSDFLINDREEVSHIQKEVLQNALKELNTSKPVQYITGKAHFYGHEFMVNSATLIPRQETEELVHMIIENHKKDTYLNMIDIGTGTGCVGLSLKAAMSSCSVTLMDVSSEALETAQANAARLKTPVKTILEDVLTLEELPEQYDVIVSNPPYVRNLEKQEIHDNVLENEPHLALFVEDHDALIFYRKILELAQKALKKDGVLYFEINQYLPEEMKNLATELGFESQIYKDLNGNYRMMKAHKNEL
ncbi:release factor glutamine methyltransferase [Nonlabens xylanidelens]|uniref:peptide chain release factor N(5)-glutamine methyltransferase n=1 Tax=Nonlabens xylanidelens TaxID=191564 RepID=A0A2S6IL63_9FLAO|nr:peptide chain release factor N(5)-glutamine methyltransferase [Nonlabens xylanidelens]PPK94974.1 release factor glutamine methyltransferase [Nonlabens xylanidelens]PQJ17517.1 protein-(glutamine-N5) methyltransferase, release factor-specific [Nonlabens xylanidelens]